ncbi:MAG: preprotein translocase subunit SecG [Candidatus Aminicenantaceae bacterium]
MSALLLTIHIIVCFILIIAVLLQSGKSADLAGAFGGAGSQTVFGPRGAATILSKTTTVCAILFMITSMGFWFLSEKGTKSVVKGEEVPAKEAPAVTETKKEPTKQKAQEPKEQQDKKQSNQAKENKK